MTFALLGVFFRQSLARMLTNRAAAVLTLGFGVLFAAAQVVAILVAFRFTDSLGEWSLYHVLFLLGIAELVQVAYAVLFVNGHESLFERILEGELDYEFARPVDSQMLAIVGRFDLPSLPTAVLPLALLVYSGWHLGVSLVSWSSVAIVGATIMSVAFYTLANQILVTTAFWIDRPLGLTGTLEDAYEAAKRPASIYPRGVRFAFTRLVPIILTTNIPVGLVRGEAVAIDMAVLSAATIVLFLLARWQWRRGAMRYASAG